MDKPVLIGLIVAVAAVTAALTTILIYRKKMRRIMDRLNTMLDSATNGDFSESVFDESALSALEAKMARFLSACSASSKNLNEEKNKIKGLISDISHQTKTPIANILLYSQLLSEHPLPEDCAVCVKALSAQAEKLNFLISSLVKTSRLETGIITVMPKPDTVQNLIIRSVEQIMPKADAKNISVSAEGTDIQASFDLKWTTEAVYNILDNAVKYTGSGGTITIKAIAYELFCRIDITDNGIGIAGEEHSKIFTRFYRSAAVRNQEGVGIGLYLAREILSAQGGYMKVSSRPGRGSTFSVFLPIS
ncbi:sensor histidine kinase [Candidatus Formimonas warabiya]|uniref:histidine kinase n=1 Tax=Formimonas warabiya TaxID=1761012 RepID=A0A3G1KTK5_FORW1|nr:HAMP domain-containing sensor histidine kinase [Candidatus Formimonas warabiya]ATW25776.1 two-component sensor histidine kinase [Candidatus Formimonas warabiya]